MVEAALRPVNFHKPYTNEHLRAIMCALPTRKNAIRLADVFGRTEGAIRQIWVWARTPMKTIRNGKAGHRNNKFILQIKAIKRGIGLLF